MEAVGRRGWGRLPEALRNLGFLTGENGFTVCTAVTVAVLTSVSPAGENMCMFRNDGLPAMLYVYMLAVVQSEEPGVSRVS